MSDGLDRRQVLALGGAVVAGGIAAPGFALPASERLSLNIAPVTVELAPGVFVRTTGYNGSAPGPVVRLREGKLVEISVRNRLDTAETLHWHGLDAVGLAPGQHPILPRTEESYRFTPTMPGTFWYCSQVPAKTDLMHGQFSGQSGFLLVEPNSHAGSYDREVLLAARHWEACLAGSGKAASAAIVSYAHASFNDRKLGAGDPIKVRAGERVLFRFLNASATEDVTLALPGHRFTVTALDGAPVPNPRSVETISLAVGERVDAVVEMNSPGKWVLGSVKYGERAKGLGVIVEYENARGLPVWLAPPYVDWSHAQFAIAGTELPEPDRFFPMSLERRPGADGIARWSINGEDRSRIREVRLTRGGRHRFRWINLSSEAQSLHLPGHRFHLTRVNQTSVQGLMKDIVGLPPYGVVEAELSPNNPGNAVLHSANQLHRDYGLAIPVTYI